MVSFPIYEKSTETPQLVCAHALPLATASHASKLQTAAERRREYRIAAPTWLWNMLHRWRFPAVWAAEAGGRTAVASAPEHPSPAGLASAREVAPYTGTKLRMFPQFRCTCAPVTLLPGEHHRLQDVKRPCAHDPSAKLISLVLPVQEGICRTVGFSGRTVGFSGRTVFQGNSMSLPTCCELSMSRWAWTASDRGRRSAIAGCNCPVASSSSSRFSSARVPK